MGESFKKITESTRFLFAMTALTGTFYILSTGNLSPSGEVAAFSFLGSVAISFGASKVTEYFKKGGVVNG